LKRKARRFNRYFVLRKSDEYANQGNTWVKRQTERLRKETDRFREKISARVNIYSYCDIQAGCGVYHPLR
jgi:hypothetical protein